MKDQKSSEVEDSLRPLQILLYNMLIIVKIILMKV